MKCNIYLAFSFGEMKSNHRENGSFSLFETSVNQPEPVCGFERGINGHSGDGTSLCSIHGNI